MAVPLLISVVATVGATVHIIYKIVTREKENRYQYLMMVPILLTLFAMIFSIAWFFFGEEWTPQEHWLWTILERGSLGAIESVAEILGITNILFGWIYTERNKLTLGKSQLELIEYQFGKFYTGSVAIHFFATALCLILTKVGAREGTLFSFLALSCGCVLQVLICSEIGLNPKNREECSIALWEKESTSPADYVAPAVIEDMIRCLSDPSVYVHEGYRDVLFKKLAAWLGDFPEIRQYGQQSFDQMAADIRLISYKLHTLLETVPKSERRYFSEELLQGVCKYLGTATAGGCAQVELLCCGYVHCIYNMNKTDGTMDEMDRKMDILASHIFGLTYYFQNQDPTSSYTSQFFLKILGGLDWYLFLTQRARLPRYAVIQNSPSAQVNDIFTAFICSIFDLDDPYTRERNARSAWDQI